MALTWRNADDRYKGEMMANFKRGKGDNMGAAGYLNDRANIPTDVAFTGQTITACIVWQET